MHLKRALISRSSKPACRLAEFAEHTGGRRVGPWAITSTGRGVRIVWLVDNTSCCIALFSCCVIVRIMSDDIALRRVPLERSRQRLEIHVVQRNRMQHLPSADEAPHARAGCCGICRGSFPTHVA